MGFVRSVLVTYFRTDIVFRLHVSMIPQDTSTLCITSAFQEDARGHECWMLRN